MACHQLLAVILLTDEVAEPHFLWDQFKAGLCDDVKHKLHHMNRYQADQEIPEDDVYDYSLWNLNRILVGIRKYYKLHLAISLSILHQFSQSQWL